MLDITDEVSVEKPKRKKKRRKARRQPKPPAPASQPSQAKDKLDELEKGDPLRLIMLMLWKNRLREPDMYVAIEEKDIAGLEDCVAYLKVKPAIRIHRPRGLPAQPVIAPTATRRGVPAREAQPAKPYVIVSLVEQGTENLIKPVENNEEDYDRARDEGRIRKARDQAPDLAARIVQQARTGEMSLSDMQDQADALLLLARWH